MGTHCRITDGEEASYVHYDGMPSHMMPELRAIVERGGEAAINTLLAHDWSSIDSDQSPGASTIVAEGVVGFGLAYTDRPKLSKVDVKCISGAHVYFLDRATLTVKEV